MEYKIAYASSTAELHELVNGSLKEGYQPIGGIAVVPSIKTSVKASNGDSSIIESPMFYQALFKVSNGLKIAGV
jgi:hypothetical protein